MVDRLAANLFGRHVGRRAGIVRHFLGLVRPGLGQVEIHQPHAGVACQQDVFRLEIEMHEAAFMHVLEGNRHVD